jgi:hypothetical protein
MGDQMENPDVLEVSCWEDVPWHKCQQGQMPLLPSLPQYYDSVKDPRNLNGEEGAVTRIIKS